MAGSAGRWSVRGRLRKVLSRLISGQGATAPVAGATTESTPAYSADRPISSPEADRFDRWPFARRVAGIVADRVDPGSLVIGIYGEWGEGKTSALNLILRALKEQTGVIPVVFNPWYFGSELELIQGFFRTLADALGQSLTTRREEIGELLKKYGSLLSVASLTVGGVVSISPGSAAKGLGQALSTVELDQLRERLGKLLRAASKRVLVLIDDIDRLDRREIQAVFKLVKLSANLDYTTYVLAFDDATVAAALGQQYGAGDTDAGRRFLEKIVQVPLHLPPASEEALRSLMADGVNAGLHLAKIDIDESDGATFLRYFEDGLAPALRTPRQAILYGNAVGFALPLLKGEVHPIDQLLVEGMRVFYPKLYRSVRQNPEVVLGSGYRRERQDAHEVLKQLLQDALADLPNDSQVAARKLIRDLFPRTRSALGGTHFGEDWDGRWESEKRVSSARYFPRYFQYAVPSGDVPDAIIDNFLADAATMEPDALSDGLRHLITEQVPSGAIRKMHQRIQLLGADTAARLALAVARCGGAIPDEGMAWNSAADAAARLVAGLISRIPNADEREAVAQRVVAEAETAAFAFECMRWLCVPDDQPHAERIVPAEVEQKLKGILADRVRTAALTEPPYVQFPRVGAGLLWSWYKFGSPDEVRAYLKERLLTAPHEATKLLMAIVPTSWGLESGIRSKGDLDYGAYDQIANLVDPELMCNALRSVYGDALSNPEYHPSADLPPEHRIALQFVWLHQQRTAGASVPSNDPPTKP